MTEPTLLPCPFCGEAMQFRAALWPSEGDRDGIIHAAPTHCPLGQFEDGTFDESIIKKWNTRTRLWRGPGCALPGELNPSAKLTEADVLMIRELAREGALNQRQIAAQYPVVGWRQVGKIVRGEKWKTT